MTGRKMQFLIKTLSLINMVIRMAPPQDQLPIQIITLLALILGLTQIQSVLKPITSIQITIIRILLTVIMSAHHIAIKHILLTVTSLHRNTEFRATKFLLSTITNHNTSIVNKAIAW